MKKIKILGREISVNIVLTILCVMVVALIIGTLFFNRYTPEVVTSKTVSTESTDPPLSEYPEEFMIEKENNFDYQQGLECSAYSSAYILRYFGEQAEGLELFKTYPGKIGDVGVSPNGITTFFKDRGYTIDFIENNTAEDLKKFVSRGVPVIAFIHVEEPYSSPHNTHYVPIIGYDKEYFYFAESLEQYANCKDEEGVAYNRKTKISKFERLWTNIDAYYEKPCFVISKGEKDE